MPHAIIQLPFSSICARNLRQEHARLPWRWPPQDRDCFGFLRPETDANASIVSMLDENEALYQAGRLQKFAKKMGSEKAEQLLEDAQQILFK